MISKIKIRINQVISILRRNSVVWFFSKLIIGLILMYSLYLIGRNHYENKLESELNCFCKTDSVFIDKTNYLDQIGFTFTIYTGKQIRYLSPKDINLKTFNYSRTYTVRYLCEDYTYNELLLEDWDESKYIKDNKNRYLLKE